MSKEQAEMESSQEDQLIDEIVEQTEVEQTADTSQANSENSATEENADEETTEVEENNVEITDSVEESKQQEVSAEELQKLLTKAENKAQENWDKVLRIQAEMDNLKRRTQKDLENAHKYGLERFSKELLPVIDSLELGIQASTSDLSEVVALREGSELTIKQFESVFAKFNIEAIDPVGKTFDPELHQAMTIQENPDVTPNTILNVFQKGYILNGRLIRPAMVVVSKAADMTENQQDDSVNLDE